MNDTLADNGTISGNGIEKLGDQLVDVLHKFENETNETDDSNEFYKNYLEIIDTIMGQYCLINTELWTNLLLDSPDREGFILLSKAAAFAEDGDLFGENDIPSRPQGLSQVAMRRRRKTISRSSPSGG